MDNYLNQKIEKLDHFGRGIIRKDKDIIFVAVLVQNLNQSPCVTKGVKVYCGFGLNIEFFFEIFAA